MKNYFLFLPDSGEECRNFNLSRKISLTTSNLITLFLQCKKIIMRIEYHNLYTHFILTTLHREPIIPEKSRERIEKYITGIVQNNSSKLYAIYANPDHVHFLISRSPGISEEGIASIIAESSSRFINDNRLVPGCFAWQETASAFSVSKSSIDRVCKYILNQPQHHKKVSFAVEIEKFLKHYQKTIKTIR